MHVTRAWLLSVLCPWFLGTCDLVVLLYKKNKDWKERFIWVNRHDFYGSRPPFLGVKDDPRAKGLRPWIDFSRFTSGVVHYFLLLQVHFESRHDVSRPRRCHVNAPPLSISLYLVNVMCLGLTNGSWLMSSQTAPPGLEAALLWMINVRSSLESHAEVR